jgi:hypothetical protein
MARSEAQLPAWRQWIALEKRQNQGDAAHQIALDHHWVEAIRLC